MGPVLFFRGCDAGNWRLSALLAVPASSKPPLLSVGESSVSGVELMRRCGQTLLRYDYAVPMMDIPSTAAYRIEGHTWHVEVPARHGSLRIVFTSCNGAAGPDDWPAEANKNQAWVQIAADHKRQPFHLLLQGGDQLYADGVWREVPALAAWQRLPRRQRLRTPLEPGAGEEILDYYVRSYLRQWSQPELRPLLAVVPSLMMWDDHDIFDGWGSLRPDLQESPAFVVIWEAARTAFSLFQQAHRPDEEMPGGSRYGHFGWSYRIGPAAVIAPDLRSERTRDRVMGPDGWRSFEAALSHCADCRHILVMSSVPVLNVDLNLFERVLRFAPGQQSHQDDLRDQWQSSAHRVEWQRMLRLLFELADNGRRRVTVLSGEIHLAALGRCDWHRSTLWQLIASGVVHPPPPRLWPLVLDFLARRPSHPLPGARLEMLPLPGSGRRYLAARNWLALEISRDGTLDATWNVVDKPVSHRLRLPAPP